MPIRWKLLVLLLAMALVPLVIVTILSNRATDRLGRVLGDGARQTLTELARQNLSQRVADKALLIGRHASLVTLALQLQARQVERCLAVETPPESVIFVSRDYDEGEPPPDLTPSAYHLRLTSDGRLEPIIISPSRCVFKLAPGVAADLVHQDMLRLAMAAPDYRALQDQYGDLLHWQFTSLETGVHSSYPGHGGFPADYDARERRWYVRARAGEDVVWTLPYTDVTTGRAVVTASMPVRRPDGTVAGVTGIDVTVSALMSQAKLPGFGEATAKLIVLDPHDNWDANTPREIKLADYSPEQLGMFVAAEPVEKQREGLWHSPIERLWLEPDEPEQGTQIVRDLYEGKAEVRQVTYHGQSTLWAYSPIWSNLAHLVVIVPQEQVVADAIRAQQTVLSLTQSQSQLAAIVLVIVSLLVFLVAFTGSRSVTRPVSMLAEAARRIAAGDLDARAAVRTRDELGELARTFNRMVPQLRDRMRIRQSLALAMEVQQNLLPSSAPRIDGLDVAGRSVSCDETGGDYFDLTDLSDRAPNELGVAIGDVTGHGMAAALLMTTARALLRSRVDKATSLGEVMCDVNRLLSRDTPSGKYMTLFCARINARTRSIYWANAGHDPAIVYNPGTDAFEELRGGDLPLGIVADEAYQEFAREGLVPGQVIVLGTDGIWESRNRAGETFGKDGLRQVIRSAAAGSAVQIADAITDALEAFRAGGPCEDDVTMVVVKLL